MVNLLDSGFLEEKGIITFDVLPFDDEGRTKDLGNVKTVRQVYTARVGDGENLGYAKPDLGDMALVELGEGCPLIMDTYVNKCTLSEICYTVYFPDVNATGIAMVIANCTNINKFLVEKWKVSPRTQKERRIHNHSSPISVTV
uniref:Uncharacterized protein n=1 Tax=Solanum lycopersicum TaxID=4081 RepID=A0A3Q7GT79_SOLLC